MYSQGSLKVEEGIVRENQSEGSVTMIGLMLSALKENKRVMIQGA